MDKCDAATIAEEVLQNAVVKAINQVLGNGESMLQTLQKNIETVIAQDKNVMIGDIDVRVKTLQKELVKQVSDKQNYNEVADEIYRLRELRQDVLSDKAERENRRSSRAERLILRVLSGGNKPWGKPHTF